MRTYRFTILIMGIICFFSAILLYNYPRNEFWSSIFSGIFSSALLVSIGSLISYIILEKKTKAKVHYGIRQTDHAIRQFELYIKFVIKRLTVEVENEIVIKAYQLSYDLAQIFIELSLAEAKVLSSNEPLTYIQEIRAIAEKLGCSISEDRKNAKEHMEKYLSCTECYLAKLSTYLSDAHLLK